MQETFKPKSILRATQDLLVESDDLLMAYKPNRENALKGILATEAGKPFSMLTSPVQVIGGNISDGLNGKFYIQLVNKRLQSV